MSDRLLPCPFCGSSAEAFAREYTDESANAGCAYVFCSGCLVEQPWRLSENEAIEAWNARAKAKEQSHGRP